MSTNRELAELARKAVDVIEQRGWCQGNYTYQRRVCLLGAINIAAGLNAYGRKGIALHGVKHDLVCGLYRQLGNRAIAAWNDDPDRTEAEVKKALLQYADEIELQGEAA